MSSTQQLKASEVEDVAEEKEKKFTVEVAGIDKFGKKIWKVNKEDDEEDGDGDDEEGGEGEEEEEEEEENDGNLKYLQRRNANLKLDATVGKRQQVARDLNIKDQGIYHCPLCECTLKDNLSWLDHLNGKKHNALLGMSMKVERVGLSRVQDKFKSLQKKEKKVVENIEEFEAKYEESQKNKREKKLQKKMKQKQKAQEQEIQELVNQEQGDVEDDDERAMMLAMGLPVGLGGK